jgi:hypothetical protein
MMMVTSPAIVFRVLLQVYLKKRLNKLNNICLSLCGAVVPLRPLINHILWREMGNNTIGQQVIDDDDENVEYFMYIKNSLE